jgi:hypothetical protein
MNNPIEFFYYIYILGYKQILEVPQFCFNSFKMFIVNHALLISKMLQANSEAIKFFIDSE